MEILIFIIIIMAVVNANKKKQGKRPTPPPVHKSPARKPLSSTPAKPSSPAKLSWEETERLKKEKRDKLARSKKTEPSRKAAPSGPARHSSMSESQTTAERQREQDVHTLMERPTKAYQPARNAGERYESWMPLPESMKVIRCGYCAADNLIPKHQNANYFSCYFCREDLHE